MKKIIPSIAMAIFTFSSFAQPGNSYTAFIQQDTAIKWAAECNKIANLTPKVSDYSIKQFYLAKLKTGKANGYKLNDDKRSVSPINLGTMNLARPDWLEGHDSKFFSNENIWAFIDKKDPVKGYRLSKISNNPCCGCDETDAVMVKQLLYYKNSRFYIQDVFLTPLCARKDEEDKAAWYPICNVAFNEQPDNHKPIALSKDMVLVNSQKLSYNFKKDINTPEDSVLTVGTEFIFDLLFQDIYHGKIKAIDPQTGKGIPGKKFSTWGMSKILVPVYNEYGNVTGNKEVTMERNPNALSQIRIQQDWYFDFKNEKLFSRIKMVELIQDVITSTGVFIGTTAFCRFNY